MATDEIVNAIAQTTELDLLIARQVFNLKKVDHAVTCRNCAEADEIYAVMPYSTDIAAAWEVVAKVALPFDLCNTLMQAGETKNGQIPVRIEWCARFLVHDRYVDSISETAPLAICRAALKAVAKCPTS